MDKCYEQNNTEQDIISIVAKIRKPFVSKCIHQIRNPKTQTISLQRTFACVFITDRYFCHSLDNHAMRRVRICRLVVSRCSFRLLPFRGRQHLVSASGVCLFRVGCDVALPCRLVWPPACGVVGVGAPVRSLNLSPCF